MPCQVALLTTLILLSACGRESENGALGIDPGQALAKRSGSFELPSIDGLATYRYTVDLPPAYASERTGSRHRWQVKGSKSRDAPHVRIWMSKHPATLDDAVADAATGPLGEREVVFQEESDHAYIVIARDADGKWTQLDAWCKGDGLTPYSRIELYQVAKDAKLIKWATQVARSLRAIPATAGQ